MSLTFLFYLNRVEGITSSALKYFLWVSSRQYNLSYLFLV